MLSNKTRKETAPSPVPPGSPIPDRETPFVQRILQILYERCRILLFAMAAVLLACSVLFYCRSNQQSGAILSLNYEESTAGLTPSGSRFSASEIRSEEVMTRAIEYAGLTGQVDPYELAQCVGVDSYSNRGFGVEEEDNYIATSYYVSLTDRIRLPIDPEQMLKLILKAYKDVFFSKYADTSTVFPQTDVDYSSMEYMDIVDYLDLRLSKIYYFLNKQIEEDREFTSASTGLTFKQLQEMQSNLSSLPYAQLEAYIWEHGIARDAAMSIQTLQYKNSRLSLSYEQYMDEYEIRVNTIEAYQNSMIDSVLIPTYDASNEYYMARTKIGIDDLALEAEDYLSQAKEVQTSIDNNQDMITKIEAGATAQQRSTADQMITDLDSQITDLERLVTQVNREYLNSQTHNYLTIQYMYPDIAQKLNLSLGLLLALVVGVALLIGFYLDSTRTPPASGKSDPTVAAPVRRHLLRDRIGIFLHRINPFRGKKRGGRRSGRRAGRRPARHIKRRTVRTPVRCTVRPKITPDETSQDNEVKPL